MIPAFKSNYWQGVRWISSPSLFCALTKFVTLITHGAQNNTRAHRATSYSRWPAFRVGARACALRVRPGGAGQAGRGPRPASGAEGRSVGPTLSLRHGRRRKAMLCRLPWEPRGAGPPLRPPSRRRAQHVRRGHPEARRASSSLGGTREQRFESRERFAAPRAVAEASGVGAPRLRPRGVGGCPRALPTPRSRFHQPRSRCLVAPARAASPRGKRTRADPGETLSWAEYISPKIEKWFPAKPHGKRFTKRKGPRSARPPSPGATATPVIHASPQGDFLGRGRN